MRHQTTIFQTVKDISFLLLLIYWGYCFWAIFKIARWVAAFSADHSFNITCVTLQAAAILLAGLQLIWVKLSAKKIKWISSAAFTVIFQIICALAVAVLIMLE